MHYTTILFDLDGTLMDTSQGIFASANHALSCIGYPAMSDEALHNFVGPPLADCFRTVCGVDESFIDDAVRAYRAIYHEKGWSQSEAYPQIGTVLKLLSDHGARLAVSTLKLEYEAMKIISHFHLSQYFDVVTGTDLTRIHSKYDTIRESLRRLGVIDFSTAVMVGDTIHDYEGAKKANIDFIGVDWGFGFIQGERKKQLPGFVAMIQDPGQLIPLIDTLS